MKVGQLSGGHFARQMEKVHSCSHGIRKMGEKGLSPRGEIAETRWAEALKTLFPSFRTSTILILHPELPP